MAMPGASIAFGPDGPVSLGTFLQQVRALAAVLPSGRHAINLCEDRYRFLVAFCAVALRGQTTLLPPSRAPAVIDEELRRHADSYCLGDGALQPEPPRYCACPSRCPMQDGGPLRLDDAALVAIGFTSGSTGAPTAEPEDLAQFPRQHRPEPRRAAATCGPRDATAQRGRDGAAAAHVRHGDVGAAAAAGQRRGACRAPVLSRGCRAGACASAVAVACW